MVRTGNTYRSRIAREVASAAGPRLGKKLIILACEEDRDGHSVE
jgi:hypothetical protein